MFFCPPRFYGKCTFVPLSPSLSLSLSTIWQDDAAQKPSSGSAARRPARCMERRRRPCSRAVRGYRHYTMQKSDRLLSRLIDAVDACYTPSPLFGTNLVSISLCDPALRRPPGSGVAGISHLRHARLLRRYKKKREVDTLFCTLRYLPSA